MKHRQAEDEAEVKSEKPEWYREAGRGPFAEDGFTPQLMARIELAAERRNGAGKVIMRRRIGLAGVTAVLLLGALLWPLAGGDGEGYTAQISSFFGKKNAAAVPPSASPSATTSAAAEAYNPPLGSAEFELGGVKYYMPLPSNVAKTYAQVLETPLGIVWSPPPPMTDYLKPKYTRNTEPYSLYLTPKGHVELSADSAKRIYTFPLYVGSAQTYFGLGQFYSAGDYLLVAHYSYRLGEERDFRKWKLSRINLKEAAAGKVSAPEEILNLDASFTVYRSFMAINPDREELLAVNYTEDGKGGYIQKNKLYDIAGGKSQLLKEEVLIENKEKPTVILFSQNVYSVLEGSGVAHYELNGKKYTAEIVLFTGQQWYYDYQSQEYKKGG
ncbi:MULTISPECIES: hypothetical protein [unclassified Paenibacillus]|uniref:hypothetical protein n=1 Tax=unclassified Paenibacillus TaxID=185978 RepID=UPI0024063478|nr:MULTISPECIES: hypothetical protein [unclassified Paenibacillus]MDF9843985.1 hypothetical protein [Paenibacillus sp. PastF-2]MDF9850590.1 hypothetical protein [Paenibacillus sp. PastM-2]MDF9856316.1 hypothetical protein [Paenibacillus sp. PastF-1]MDH6481455.1 hypothetical protein [Paenibacillus sp. PastH-2]MDH6509769.1 hypothetical protein [Paenibacillus sp. PastM-3]